MTARLNILFLILLLLSACCKKKEPCHSCPLPNGDYCAGGMINVFNNCQCPEGSFWFMNGCISQNNPGSYWGELNCKCLGDVVIRPEYDNLGISIMVNDVFKSFATALNGSPQNFEFSLIFPEFSCNQLPNNNYPRFVGNVVSDTLFLNIYWHEFGPNVETPVDSCINIKLAPVWTP